MSNSPFHNPQSEPLPDANDIEQEFAENESDWQELRDSLASNAPSRPKLNSDKRKLRNLMIGLLVAGLVLGGILSIGLVWTLDRLGLSDPPAVEQQQ
jgi:hypothetical protein